MIRVEVSELYEKAVFELFTRKSETLICNILVESKMC